MTYHRINLKVGVHQSLSVEKHVDQKDLSTILAAKRPASVAPGLSLSNPLHAGSHGFETSELTIVENVLVWPFKYKPRIYLHKNEKN